MADIKLFVCCHQPTEIPNHPLLVPIQVGTAIVGNHLPGFLYDNTGDNISIKNRSYCELTAHYWAWKNVQADYYGFFHYRRYLYPDMKAKSLYQIKRKVEISLLDKLGYEDFADLIQQYDLILPKGENMYIPVREHYAKASFHHRKDLELIEKIVKEVSPEYWQAFDQYLSGTVCYFGNIFIMRKKLFQDYCNWLFPILEEFDRRVDTSNYNPQELRVDGYLAERLLGGFYYMVKDTGAKILKLPRMDIIQENGNRWKRKILASVFLPGSKRRAIMKRLCKG